MSILSTSFRFFFVLLLFMFFSPYLVEAANNLIKTVDEQKKIAHLNLVTINLSEMQKMLDKIKQEVSTETNDSKLNYLNDMTLKLSSKADKLIEELILQRTQFQKQLAVLGSVPRIDFKIKETAAVSHNRIQIKTKKLKIDEQIKQIETIKNDLINLSKQIVNLRRDALKTQLALSTVSILNFKFWFPLFTIHSHDTIQIHTFLLKLIKNATISWQIHYRLGTIFWMIISVLTAIFGRHYLEKLIIWIGINYIPESRLRRSYLAISTVIITLFIVIITFYSLNEAFFRSYAIENNVSIFIKKLLNLSIFCALIDGLGRALLSTYRPSWRLLNISNETTLMLKRYPLLIAVIVFILQTVEILNSSSMTSVNSTIFANGITALLISAISLFIKIRINKINNLILKESNQRTEKTVVIVLINMMVTLLGISIIISLMIGYITLARFLSYELLWLGIVLALFYIISQLISDSCETIFSTNNNSGKRIQNFLKIEKHHLNQIAVLLSALGKVVLVFVAIIALLNNTFGSSTSIELLQSTIKFWIDKGLDSLNVLPAHIMHALIFLITAIWILHLAKTWLEKDFLPKTKMDQGMQISLITLFSNIGYVFIILIALSIMGLQWSRIAWIVSALSVGIGFGLQEIVKNFISGLILLTERPVKVGDLVSISGIEGDIRRINVRATEIQLSDKSTVIVPNSQFISQNVRNATMGNVQGLANITLTFPLNIDLYKIKKLLIDAYNQNQRILKNPKPTVSFKDVSNTGIVISVTGNVISPRFISAVKSDLLYDIVTRLRKENIILSISQKMIIERQK